MPKAASLQIMIVDDQGTMRSLIRSCLRQIGCQHVVECADGEEALKKLSGAVELVISDINMPKLDGFGLLRAIRGTPGVAATPFILLTSRGEVNAVKHAMELKVNSYLVKPFTVDGLKRKIESVLGPLT